MIDYKPLSVLPGDIQQDWLAYLVQAMPTTEGVFRLVDIRRTKPKTYEEQRVIALVVDENGFPMPGINVAFAYSTHPEVHYLTQDFLWTPPSIPVRALAVPTAGSGQIDQIQGSAVNQGQPGGITVFCFEPRYSSDVVVGAGMLADHTGLHLTFQLQRPGRTSIYKKLAELESRLIALEGRG